MDLGLQGACVVISGGTRGIGFATARRMLDEGAQVSITGTTEAGVGDALVRLNAHNRAHGFVCNVAAEADVEEAFARAVNQMGALDVFVANAGITGIAGNLIDMSSEHWDQVQSVDYRGAFLTCREAARHMRRHETRGRIVLVSSALAEVVEPLLGHYNAAKAGVLGLMRSFAVDLAPFGIRVNAISPGLVATDQAVEYLEAGIVPGVLGRAGESSEIAASIAFLASDVCAFTTGASFIVDGGASIVMSASPFGSST